MSDGKNTKIEQPRLLFVDEMGSYFGGQNDHLKEALREIDGVPDAKYLVRDGLVFVFDKLVQLVKERQSDQSDMPVAELARNLVDEATVSAKEAVEAWGVVPVPYEMKTVAGRDIAPLDTQANSLLVRHRPFNAHLPGSYQNENDVQAAFANILVGGIQPGSGDFTYRGQPMTLCEPLDLTLLPARPVTREGLEPASWFYTELGNINYEPGFEPVSEVMFNRVKELETDWRDDIARAATHAQNRVDDMWTQTADLRIGTLNDPSDEVPEYGLEDFAELRSYYPELSMLSDGSLYSLFDVFQMECRFINGWSANRDNDFLFYLLGKVVDRENDHESAKEVGEWVADALLHGDTLDTALRFGRDATRYNQAIGKLAHRVASAMRFLAEDKKATDLRGHAITTMGDAFRIGRKFNATMMVAEQKLPL
ncbi:hypothetical protein [Pseudomonas fluorescens]|uniref:hypothetical protein n=1 Tax=Pseudomonas fluorescens TaxID=294 RepID=UPI0010EE4090|nr:hypothetical protein [Pseudomonas fluorescens]TCV62880.1 hypothetical protein EDB98_112188 [Pseudomonas fluorescens]